MLSPWPEATNAASQARFSSRDMFRPYPPTRPGYARCLDEPMTSTPQGAVTFHHPMSRRKTIAPPCRTIRCHACDAVRCNGTASTIVVVCVCLPCFEKLP